MTKGFATVDVLRCACSPKCKLLAISINGRRITPQKHSGNWNPLAEWEIDKQEITAAALLESP